MGRYKDIEKKRAYQNAWHKKNKDKTNAQNKAYRARVRAEASRLKAGGCVQCGEMDVSCLVFHHKGGKKLDVSMSYGIPSMLKEAEKCIVLCANCHAKLHAKERLAKEPASNGAAF